MPSSKLGNIRNSDISREILVAVHLEGKEAWKLDFVESSESVASLAVLTWKMDSSGFYFSRGIRYNLIFLI